MSTRSGIPQLVQALSGPLLLEPAMIALVAGMLRRKLAGERFTAEEIHQELGIAMPGAQPTAAAEGSRVAIIPVMGLISQHPNSAGTSTDGISAMFKAALESPQVDAILLNVDSPGGEVTGVPELAEQIYAGRQKKRITAITNGLAASAGYWIAAAADEVVSIPSGRAGSIGVYMLHQDWSKNLEQDGITITAITAGKYKTEGAPWAPLSPETQAFIQGQVDEVYDWFTKAVAKFRGATPAAVKSGYGEGRVLPAKDAKAANLVDRIATFDETLTRMVAARPVRRMSAATTAKALGAETLL